MSDTFLRVKQVSDMVALSKSEIYKRVQRGVFPRQKRLSHRIAVWSQQDVTEWMNKQSKSHA